MTNENKQISQVPVADKALPRTALITDPITGDVSIVVNHFPVATLHIHFPPEPSDHFDEDGTCAFGERCRWQMYHSGETA